MFSKRRLTHRPSGTLNNLVKPRTYHVAASCGGGSYSRGGGRGSGHGYCSKDARRGGLGDHCRRLFLPSGDAAPAVARCPRGGWSDPDRRIRKPLASARRPILILGAKAPLWSQPTQATPVIGTASGASQLAAFGLPTRRAFSNCAKAFGLNNRAYTCSIR